MQIPYLCTCKVVHMCVLLSVDGGSHPFREHRPVRGPQLPGSRDQAAGVARGKGGGEGVRCKLDVCACGSNWAGLPLRGNLQLPSHLSVSKASRHLSKKTQASCTAVTPAPTCAWRASSFPSAAASPAATPPDPPPSPQGSASVAGTPPPLLPPPQTRRRPEGPSSPVP